MSNRRLLVSLFIGFICLFGAVPIYSANIVTNGDFETGNTSGWALANSVGFDTVCTTGQVVGAATCSVNSGTFAMTFGHAGSATTMTQDLTTLAGSTYNLSFWLRNDNPGGGNTETFAVLWNGVSVFSLGSPQPSFPYTQQVFLDLLATTNLTPLQFQARQDPSQWFLDDVAVNIVPEPASALLTSIALLGLAWASAKHRRREYSKDSNS